MSNRWKLKYEAKRWRIYNQKGKDLSYHPNSGIRILVEDGYAFKDVNRNGEIDPFEDWRLPMKRRIQDFTERYQLVSKGKRIYYKQGFAEIPQDLLTQLQESEQVQALMEEDRAFFKNMRRLLYCCYCLIKMILYLPVIILYSCLLIPWIWAYWIKSFIRLKKRFLTMFHKIIMRNQRMCYR